nr:hypothetical protein [Tanacetum cinerariifolium]
MDDPNITMEEYIRLEEEKSQKRGKVFNWETTKYAIVYNDALTSKSDFSTETTLCPQHINKLDFKDETSLSEYDEVEQNVLYFNDILPFNIIYPNDLKSDKDNDDNEIDLIQSSRGNENAQGSHKLLEASHDKINNVFKMKSFIMKLNVNIVARNYFVNGMLFNLIKNLYVPIGIPFDPKRYYKDGDYTRMLRRPRIPLFPPVMSIRDLRIMKWVKIVMAPLPPRDQRYLWLRYQVEAYTEEIVYDFERRLEMIFGRQEMAEDGFRSYWLGSERVIPDKGGLSDYWVKISSGNKFLRGTPSYTHIRDPIQRMCHKLISYSISGFQVPATDLFYLYIMDQGLSERHFIGRLAHHFGLVSDDELRGLSIINRKILLIDMGELVKLKICMEIEDGWAWVGVGPEMQPDAAVGAPIAIEDALAVDKGAQADLAPNMRSLRGLVERSITDQGRFYTWMISCVTQLVEASGQTYQALFDGTFLGSSPAVFERRTRQRTDGANTSVAPQQPDP